MGGLYSDVDVGDGFEAGQSDVHADAEAEVRDEDDNDDAFLARRLAVSATKTHCAPLSVSEQGTSIRVHRPHRGFCSSHCREDGEGAMVSQREYLDWDSSKVALAAQKSSQTP